MSEGSIQTIDELVEGIQKGMVPRQVRLFAAQGLLPVSREDLLRLQVILSSDPDEELASLARESVAGQPEEVIQEWLKDENLGALELDLLARILKDSETVWATIAQHPNVSDETLRMLARHGTPLVQDIVITNQVRILSCLDILEDLRANPQVTKVVLRRVKEFEDEFIRKAAEQEGDLELPEPGPSVEEALAELKAIGSHIPAEGELAVPEAEDSVLAREAEARGENAFARILLMSTHEKIITALKGSREERAILINSRNRLVARAVLASPKLTQSEIETFAASRSVSDEVVRTIAQNPRWLRRYAVVHALLQNPKTPVQIALHLLPRLNHRHLKQLGMNRNIHPAVRQQAARMYERRR